MASDRLDLELADAVLDRMGSITGGLGELLAELESTVEPELAGWTDAARAQYLAAKLEWAVAAARMPECVDRARRAFGEIARTHDGPGPVGGWPHGW
jgi:uncharacterized protein YukE